MKVIVDIKGGLGNQLFCYATAYALSKRTNAKLSLDISMYRINNVKDRNFELQNFGIKYDRLINYNYSKNKLLRKLGLNRFKKKCAIGFGTKLFIEKKAYVFDENIESVNKNVYLDGFWQSDKYFKKYRKELLEQIEPVKGVSNSALQLLDTIRKENAVSIHVRHGDYVGLGWNIPMKYYDEAIEKMMENGQNKTFVVFSDDTDFCREYFKKYDGRAKFIYPEYESSDYVIDDMYLMSKCTDNIIANSSYSWWGAWLNKNECKKVICPKTSVWDGDFYPEEWVKINIC